MHASIMYAWQPDVLAVRSFRRHIMSFDVDPTDVVDSGTGAQVYVLNIRGTAFLWHQVKMGTVSPSLFM